MYTGAPEPARTALEVDDATHEDAVAKPRWINWPLPQTLTPSRLTIRSDKPLRVYSVELHRAIGAR